MKLKTICAFALCLNYLVSHAQIIEVSQQISPVSIENLTVTTAKTNVLQTCCTHFQNLVKTTMPTVLAEIKLDETSSVYDFGNGPQAYLFFELPVYKKPYHININNIPQAPGIFNLTEYSQIPMIIETFDNAFNSKRVYKHVDMKKRGLGFDKTIFINPANETEKYVLVYGNIKAEPEEKIISERGVTTTAVVGGLALTLLVAVATGGAYIPSQPIIADGVDRKVAIAPNDKGIIIIESKGLNSEK